MGISPVFKAISKRDGYEELFFPVHDFSKAKEIQKSEGVCVWVFINDMRPHKKAGRTLPSIILPSLLGRVFPFAESEVLALGYKPYWVVFRNAKTGETTFGNKPSFMGGDEKDRQRAGEMTVINLDRFLC